VGFFLNAVGVKFPTLLAFFLSLSQKDNVRVNNLSSIVRADVFVCMRLKAHDIHAYQYVYLCIYICKYMYECIFMYTYVYGYVHKDICI